MMTKENIKKILLIAAVIILMLTAAFNILALWHGVLILYSVFEPVIIGFCLAFILNLLVNLFEKRVFFKLSTPKKSRKRLIRVLSIICTLIVFILAVALILLVIIPQVTKTVSSIVASLPQFADRAMVWTRDMLERFGMTTERITNIVLGGEAVMDKITAFAQTNLNGVLKSVVSFGGAAFGVTSDIFFGLFIAIYFLFDKDRILSQCKRLLNAIFKKKVYGKMSHVGTIAYKSFSGFIGGQLIEAVILALLCFIGMLIFRFPYAPVVSVLIGVTALIPIVGAWVGGALSALLILTNNPVKALWFLLFFIILQQLEGNFIYPRVVGKQIGLPGVWVLLAVVIGSGFMGAAGALIAVPLSSVLYTLATEYVIKTEKTNDTSLE